MTRSPDALPEMPFDADFDRASDHAYECKCEICRKWWRACGPEMEDDDMPAGYGPFGKEKP